MQCRHSKMDKNIEHEGIVTDIRDGIADIRIVQYSACSGCHIKSACTVADKKEKIVEVPYNDMEIKIGDKVLIVGSNTIGTKAVLIAFLYPFILLFCTLFIIYSITSDEALSGIASLTVLIPYYVLLYFFKNKLKKKFEFSLKSI